MSIIQKISLQPFIHLSFSLFWHFILCQWSFHYFFLCLFYSFFFFQWTVWHHYECRWCIYVGCCRSNCNPLLARIYGNLWSSCSCQRTSGKCYFLFLFQFCTLCFFSLYFSLLFMYNFQLDLLLSVKMNLIYIWQKHWHKKMAIFNLNFLFLACRRFIWKLSLARLGKMSIFYCVASPSHWRDNFKKEKYIIFKKIDSKISLLNRHFWIFNAQSSNFIELVDSFWSIFISFIFLLR